MSELLLPLIERNQTDSVYATCLICYSTDKEFHTLQCSHTFCLECLQVYLSLKIAEGQVLIIHCPYCSTIMDQLKIKSLIPDGLHEKYLIFHKQKTLESDINFRWCPQKECSGFDIYQVSNSLICNKCQFEFCFLCGEICHPGKKCKVEDSGFRKWAAENTLKKCPKCRMNTEKNGGCTHVSCPKCGINWCWICGNDLNNHEEYSCYMGKSLFNSNWDIIFLLILSPIALLFFVLIGYWYYLKFGILEEQENWYTRFCSKHTVWSSIFFFIISPPVFVLAFGIGIFILPFILPCSALYAMRKVNFSCLRLLLYFVFLAITILLLVIALGLSVIVIGLAQIAGVFMLVSKIVWILFIDGF